MFILSMWVACAGGPDCVLTPDGDCVPEAPVDVDDDGQSVAQGDCDDNDAALYDLDLDGDGFSPCVGDCRDDEPSMQPPGQLAETCDGVDNDCDGVVDGAPVGGSVCVLSHSLDVPAWTALDLVFVGDSDLSFRDDARFLGRSLEQLFAPLEATDTRVAFLDGRTGTVLQSVGGSQWMDLRADSALEAANFVSALADATTFGRVFRPFQSILAAMDEPQNASFFRDGVRTAILVHSATDNDGMTAPEFRAQFDGEVVVFGADPALGCGGTAVELAFAASAGQFHPYCVELEATLPASGAFLAPGTDLVYSFTEQAAAVDGSLLPATRRASLLRRDGTRIELGPLELEWSPEVSTMRAIGYEWADVESAVFEIEYLVNSELTAD